MLKANLDWLHFGFTTMALQSEHVAKSIGAKMAVSCRGYDMDVYPLKNPNCYSLIWVNVDKVHAISKYMLTRAVANGMLNTTENSIITPAINTSLFQDNIEKQIDPFDPVILTNQKVETLEKFDGIFEVTTSNKNLIRSKCIIIAAGNGAFGPNRPPLQNIESYENKTVFYHIKDKSIFKKKRVAIAGGGDSAVDWAIELSEKCEKIFGFESLKGYGKVRIYGFLAERFMSYWFKKYTKYKTLPIIFYDIRKDINY